MKCSRKRTGGRGGLGGRMVELELSQEESVYNKALFEELEEWKGAPQGPQECSIFLSFERNPWNLQLVLCCFFLSSIIDLKS